MKEINITTKEDQIKIARGFSDKIGIELNNLKKDFGSYFKQYGSINEKHISDKKLEIKKSVGNLLSQVLQD